MSSYFYHGTTDLDSLISILQTKEIKCRRLLNEQHINIGIRDYLPNPGYNGLDFISVCKPCMDSFKSYSAFKLFIVNSFSVIIEGEIDAVKTTYCSDIKTIYDKYLEDNNYRYSDLKDEWQIKTSVPFDKIVGIAIPFKRIYNNIYDPRKVKQLIELAQSNNLIIIDSNDNYFNIDYSQNIINGDLVDRYIVNENTLFSVIESANERIKNEDYTLVGNVKRKIFNIKKSKILSSLKAR